MRDLSEKIVESIVKETSLALLNESETNFITALKKAEECGKTDAFMKLVLFEIEHNLEAHI